MIRSTVIKNFFIYSCGSLFLRGVSLFITPLIMHQLTPEDYGLLSIAMSFINVGAALAGLGLRQLLSIEYFRLTHSERPRLITHIITLYSLIMLPIFLISLYNITWINNIIFIQCATHTLITITLLLTFGQFFVELLYQLLQYQGKAFTLTLIQTGAALTLIISNLFFLFILEWGALSSLIAQLISMMLVCTVALGFFYAHEYHKHLVFNQTITQIRGLLAGSIPFLPRVLCAWILASGDRWVLARYATMHDVGIYSVADLFGQLFQFIVILPLSHAYLPYIMEKYHRESSTIKQVEQKNLMIMFLCMITLALMVPSFLWIAKPLIMWLLPTKFHTSLPHLPVLVLGYIFLLGSYFASSYIQYQKKLFFLAFSLFIPAVLNIALNILLVPYYNISGCVWATTVSYGVYFFITLVYNRHVIHQTTSRIPIITPQAFEIAPHVCKPPED